MVKKVPLLCQCLGFSCDLSIQVPPEVAEAVLNAGYVVIVDGCKFGPDPIDEPVDKSQVDNRPESERGGYTLYK